MELTPSLGLPPYSKVCAKKRGIPDAVTKGSSGAVTGCKSISPLQYKTRVICKCYGSHIRFPPITKLSTGTQRKFFHQSMIFPILKISNCGMLKCKDAKRCKNRINQDRTGETTPSFFSSAIKYDSTRNETEDTYIRIETSCRPCRVQK